MEPADERASGRDLALPPDPAGLRFDLERDLLCTADPSGRFTSLNDAWERVLGWTREELMSRPYREFVHPDDVRATEAATALLAEPAEQLTRFENRYRTADGGWRWLRWSVRSDGDTLIGIAIDVTDERRASTRIQTAISEGRLLAYGQPVVELASGRTVGHELLARLRDRDHEDLILPPAEFLGEAAKDGSISLVDLWMTRRALAVARDGEPLTVNLSGVTITSEDALAELIGHLEEAPAGAAGVGFELAEQAALAHPEAAVELSQRLAAMGRELTIDGFGTGLGNLAAPAGLAVRTVKIDRDVIAGIEDDIERRALARGVGAMAAELGLTTVAVGIERPETLALCMEFEITHGQGFLLERSAPFGADRPAGEPG